MVNVQRPGTSVVTGIVTVSPFVTVLLMKNCESGPSNCMLTDVGPGSSENVMVRLRLVTPCTRTDAVVRIGNENEVEPRPFAEEAETTAVMHSEHRT